MRSLFFVIAVSLSACATTQGPSHANIPLTRHQIDDAIAAEHGDRKINSMGKVTDDRAVVYTTAADGTRQEETWVKSGGAWKLENKTAISATPQTEGN